MKKKHRKILFISFLLLFFIATPILIFYTQGYRIDLENRRIIQTGGLFFEITPKQTSIYLNDEFTRKTAFFFNSVLLENLLPRKYNVKIKKENYRTWEKNLSVKEKQVTEVSGITLFPKDFNFQTISNKVNDFWISPKKEEIIWKEKDGETWSLKLYDLNQELQSHLVSETDISRRNVDLMNLNFSENGEKIYLEVISAEQLKTFSLNINKGSSSLKEEKQPQRNKQIIASHSFNNQNYFLNNSGYLYKTSESLNQKTISNKEKLNQKAFTIKQETPYKLYVFPEFIFLKEDNTTYLFNSRTKQFEEFFTNIKNLKLSPDRKTIAYYRNGEIWIIPIQETKIYDAKKQVFIARFSEPIQNLFWVNSKYLAFNTKEKVRITEIDTRDNLNIIDVGKFPSSEIFWSPITKRLYILKNKTLKHSKELLP